MHYFPALCSSHKVTYILLLFRRCDCLYLWCVTRKMLYRSGPTNQHQQSEQNSVQKQPADLVLHASEIFGSFKGGVGFSASKKHVFCEFFSKVWIEQIYSNLLHIIKHRGRWGEATHGAKRRTRFFSIITEPIV